MSLLMADTTLIDQMLDDALRALDHLSDGADVLDFGCDLVEHELDDRPAPEAPGANLLAWPRHLIGTR